MKLLVQGDDYGFTKGVTYGILDAIDNGVLRNTGLFANMPYAEWACSEMPKRPQACFGIDFNLVSGPSVCDPKEVPHLVDENGEFIRSGVRVHDPRWQSEEGRREMFPYDEVYKEIRAQYDRFVELTGKKPGYLHGHSISHETYREAIAKVSADEGVPFSQDIRDKYHFTSLIEMKRAKGLFSLASQKKVFDPNDQLNKNPLKDVLDNWDYLLQQEYVMIGGHPGFLDAELLGLTTLSIERVRDHQMCVSEELRKRIEEDGVELITYYDLY